MSVTTTDNSPSLDYTHLDDQTKLAHITPKLKPYTEALDWETPSLCQGHRKCIENSRRICILMLGCTVLRVIFNALLIVWFLILCRTLFAKLFSMYLNFGYVKGTTILINNIHQTKCRHIIL